MSNKKKYTLFASMGFLIIIVFLGFYNRKLINVYYHNFNDNKFREGDKVYAHKYFTSDLVSSKTPLLRLIKSTTTSDFKVISSGNAIVNDSASKYKSSYIGTYIGYKIFPVTTKSKEEIYCIYSINPNWKLINKSASAPDPLPPNYVFVDDNFYISWKFGVGKEVNKF